MPREKEGIPGREKINRAQSGPLPQACQSTLYVTSGKVPSHSSHLLGETPTAADE